MVLTARDIMDEPDYIPHDADMDQVIEDFHGSENTLIVTKNGDFVGEIHEATLLKDIIPQDRLDEEKVVGILGFGFDGSYSPDTAEDLMNNHDITVPPDEEAGEMAFIMDREDLRSLPVKEDGEIIGVVHEDRLIEEAHNG
ncbi:MAG: CBS domain-containing protein [Colwellia polaris]|jgi:CBS domain-containing protein